LGFALGLLVGDWQGATLAARPFYRRHADRHSVDRYRSFCLRDPGVADEAFSAFAGGVALALIMVPIVARTTEEMLKLVPHSLREGALALGAPQWRVTLGVVVPAAAPGIATGAMLAIARVSGETAPLLFTAFGSRFFRVVESSRSRR
jgi:ABC-type phosphate transport system permease subunit